MMAWVVRYGPTLIAALAACAALWWAYSWAWDQGYDARSLEVIEDTRELNEKLARKDQALRDLTRAYLAMKNKTTALQSELDDAAREDADADRPAFGDGSVQRLNQIR
jgi:hypothetical protein